MPCTMVISAALLVMAQAPAPSGTGGPAATERADVPRATPIRLQYSNRTLAEIVADLNAQVPMSVMLPPAPPDPIGADHAASAVAPPRRFTLVEPGPVPFWEAIDRLCRTTERWPGIAVFRDPTAPLPAPGAPVAEPDPRVVLVPASRDRGFVWTDGPFRIVVARVSCGRDIRFTPPLFPQPGADVFSHDRPGDETFFLAELIIMVEPRLKIEQLGELKVLDATDDRSNDLLVSGFWRLPSKGRHGLIPPDAAAVSVPVALRYPGEPGRLIKRLRGRMPIEVSQRKGGTHKFAATVNFDFADIPMP